MTFNVNKPVTITLEEKDGTRLQYTSDHVTFYSHYGSYNELQATGLTRVPIEPIAKEATVPTEAPATESGLNNEQRQALELVLTRAKAIERQQFHNARAIASAAREAGKLMADSEHKFIMGILDALHAGLTQEAVEEHLEDHGFNQLNEKVDAVHMLDTELLYPSEA